MEGTGTPHVHDVLSGRGKMTNNHPGNAYFRLVVAEHKRAYLSGCRNCARLIVEHVQRLDPPGRFLKQKEEDGLWYEIDDKDAREKARQCLSEGAKLIKEIRSFDMGDLANVKISTVAHSNPGVQHSPPLALPSDMNRRHSFTSLFPVDTTPQDETTLLDTTSLPEHLEYQLPRNLTGSAFLSAPLPNDASTVRDSVGT